MGLPEGEREQTGRLSDWPRSLGERERDREHTNRPNGHALSSIPEGRTSLLDTDDRMTVQK